MTKLSSLSLTVTLIAAASSMQAVELNYNFTADLTNSASGALFLIDGSFNADPAMATIHTPNTLGETYAVAPGGLAAAVFDATGNVLTGTNPIVYGSGNLQNAGLIYFSSFNPANGSADPIWTLSESIGSEYLTLLLNGSSAELFESSTPGSISGTPIAASSDISASATNLPASVPEPGTWGLLALAGVIGTVIRGRSLSRS